MKKLYMVSLAMLLACLSFAQTANVQIIHNSPTPGTNSGPTVDIYVNDALLPELTGVPYRLQPRSSKYRLVQISR